VHRPNLEKKRCQDEHFGAFQQEMYRKHSDHLRTRDVPNFGITEISAETEAEIRFRFQHLGMSITAEIRPKLDTSVI
jgi:hypothetical protein